MDENGIRSQQWREVSAMLHKVKYIKQVETKALLWCSMVTKHKMIDLKLVGGKEIYIEIRKRPNTFTNEAIGMPMHLHPQFNYRKFQ